MFPRCGLTCSRAKATDTLTVFDRLWTIPARLVPFSRLGPGYTDGGLISDPS